MIISIIAGRLLASAVGYVLQSLFFDSAASSETLGLEFLFATIVILLATALLAALLIAALLFRGKTNARYAWRPLAAYWKLFYAGFKFTGLSSKADGPSGRG